MTAIADMTEKIIGMQVIG